MIRGRRRNFAVFDVEDGRRIEIDLWEKVYSLAKKAEIYAYFAVPGVPVRIELIGGLQALRDERNYDRTTRRGISD